ncbi:putative ATP synthase subunit g, mitochondrial [Hypsibius exemplaris]|uniref:ATP synthase subunit g, mitochondrial n=1 Tax=Hypsibius exemplaris TaxID=2072580 RepID=A0A1W0WKZ0_HYPEX|nr:putative ATP synthase subunit g, mitochondrial [Hypsibius exemplaris]
MASLVAKIPAAFQSAKPGLLTAWKYAASELRPPTPGEIPKAIGGILGLVGSFGKVSWRKLTVKEALLNTLVAAEISFWFFTGEVIGRRHLAGYKPGFGYKGHH